jgi:hypothetical protein
MIEQLIQSKKEQLNRKLGELERVERMISERETEILTFTEEMSCTEKAVHLLQGYAENQQKTLSERIEAVVTAGIRAVFQDHRLTFRMHYSESKSGATKKAPEVTLSVSYDFEGKEVRGDLRNSFGGGLAVVVSCLLNVVIALNLGHRIRPVLLWDEPLSDLSPEYEGQSDKVSGYRNRMADFLKTLTTDTDVQIIMVTHEPNFGKVSNYHHTFSGGIGKIPTVRTKTNEVEELTEDTE